MREMKDSGIEWMGKIPGDWEQRKLFPLLDSIGSGTTPKGEEYYSDKGIPWLNTGDLNEGDIYEVSKHVTPSALNAYSTLQYHKAGSVVIALYGATIGKLGILGIEATTNQACCVMVPGNNLKSKFLFYVLKAAKDYFLYLSYGAGQPNISQNTIRNLHIPFCQEEEQTRIVNYLDTKCSQIDSIIAKQEQIIEKLKEYKLSIITEAVTKGLNSNVEMKDSGIEWIGYIPTKWKVMNLSAVSLEIRNGYVGPTRDILVDKGVPYIQSLHVKEGKISFEKGEYFVTKEWGDKHPKVYEGQIVIVQTGDIGQVGLVDDRMNGYNCHALIIVTINKNIMNPTYLQYYFRSKPGKELMIQTSTGALLPHLNSGRVKNTSVLAPSIMEQNCIVDFLEDKCKYVDKAIDKAQRLIMSLREYKKSLIYEVVTGKKEV